MIDETIGLVLDNIISRIELDKKTFKNDSNWDLKGHNRSIMLIKEYKKELLKFISDERERIR